jgi:hypothetical protein
MNGGQPSFGQIYQNSLAIGDFQLFTDGENSGIIIKFALILPPPFSPLLDPLKSLLITPERHLKNKKVDLLCIPMICWKWVVITW